MIDKRHSKTLKNSGSLAELIHHGGPPPQWVLVIDGALHSSISYEDPSKMYFDYTKRLSSLVESLFSGWDTISTLHLGAGALSMARYIEATRPGSTQVAVEIEPDLYDFVESVVPFVNKENIQLIVGDAKDFVEDANKDFKNLFDLVIVELFLGSETTTDITTLEFFRSVKGLLSTNGVIVLNVVDSGNYDIAASKGALIEDVFGVSKFVVDLEEIKINALSNILVVGSSLDRLLNLDTAKDSL